MSLPVAGRLFCFGLGYSAGRLARRLGAGWRVEGTARAPAYVPGASEASGASGEGIARHRFDRDHPFDPAHPALAEATHILVSIPPDEAGDPVARLHGDALADLPKLRWLGYLSTTGVYGDTGGAWVDETATPNPSNARAARRVEAERRWLAMWRDRGLPAHIFRLPGIYGPGRSAFDQLRAGRARRIDRPGHVFSRIHVDDIGRALAASMAAPRPGGIHNLADDEPAPQEAVIAHAARLLGVEPPPLVPLEEAEMSEMALSFWADCRRVSNAKIKAELGIAPAYPSYREGLASILAEERAQGADGGA